MATRRQNQQAQFEITKVFGRWQDKAQRYSILAPLTGPKIDDLEDIKQAIYAVRQLRQTRLLAMRNLGLADLLLGDNFKFALNCPPGSVGTNQPMRPCRRARTCPFCWGREVVVDAYQRLEYGVFGTTELTRYNEATKKREHVPPRLMDLIEIKTAQHIATLAESVELAANPAAFLRGMPAHGGYALSTIEPAEDGWRVTRRGLALVDPSCALSEACVQTANQRWEQVQVVDGVPLRHDIRRTYAGIQRKNLVFAVGRTCMYPADLLRGDLQRVMEIMEASRNKRFSVYYGILRNRAERKRNAANGWE